MHSKTQTFGNQSPAEHEPIAPHGNDAAYESFRSNEPSYTKFNMSIRTYEDDSSDDEEFSAEELELIRQLQNVLSERPEKELSLFS